MACATSHFGVTVSSHLDAMHLDWSQRRTVDIKREGLVTSIENLQRIEMRSP